MNREEIIARVANQIWRANGSQNGFAQEDWNQASNIVKNQPPSQRCAVTTKRNGESLTVLVTSGHSSY